MTDDTYRDDDEKEEKKKKKDEKKHEKKKKKSGIQSHIIIQGQGKAIIIK
jgi:FKBP-type peptidyl-prolyl cis-trans isomerase